MHNLKKALGSVLAQIENVEANPTQENILILKASVTSLHTVCPDEEKENPLFEVVAGTFAPILSNLASQFMGDPEADEPQPTDGKVVDFAGATTPQSA